MVRYKKLFCIIIVLGISAGAGFLYFGKNKSPVILIVIDSLRPDHLSCYGYYRKTSPCIDEFSEEAFMFKNAIAQSSWTVPSMVSLHTSSFPREHKLYGNVGLSSIPQVKIDSSKPTLAEALKKYGYHTGFITDMPTLSLIDGIARGFDVSIKTGVNDADRTTQESLRWLKKNRNKRFFLYLHYFGPHAPYQPQGTSSLVEELRCRDRTIPIQQGREVFGVILKKVQENNNTSLNYYLNNYDGKILYIDEYVGKLLEGIARMGLYDKSIIIITADHGEAFGEGDLFCTHSHTLYDALIRVPLLIKLPRTKGVARADLAACVGLIDIMPTVLELLNIKTDNLTFRGESIAALFKGTNAAVGRLIYSELPFYSASIRSEEYKLIYNVFFNPSRKEVPDEFELYNLYQDPYERTDLSEVDAQFPMLKKELLLRYNNITMPAIEEQDVSAALNDTLKEQLRSLGYMQ